MIQIIFTDKGKIHTVTFSGEDAEYWAEKFGGKLYDVGIEYRVYNLAPV